MNYFSVSAEQIALVEKRLQNVAGDVLTQLNLRVTIPNLITNMCDAFHRTSWYQGDSTSTEVLTEKITLILTELKSTRADEFLDSVDDIV